MNNKKYITIVTKDNAVIAYSLNNFSTCFSVVTYGNEEIVTHEFEDSKKYQDFLEMLQACRCNQMHLNLA